MENKGLNFKDSEFVKSSPKDHGIEFKHNKKKQVMKVIVPLDGLKKENLKLSDDEKHYLLYIKPSFTLPDNPDIQYEIDFRLAIKRETIDKGKLSLEEIIRRALNEGDVFRSEYNPSSDGRMWDVYYGGSF